VRNTVEQNYDQLQEVLQRYGLELDRDAARRKAARARAARGWRDGDEEPAEDEGGRPPLRLVGSRRA